VVRTATNPDYAISYFPPPGFAHQFFGGIGVKVLDSLTVDLTGGYVTLSSKIDKATADNAGVGIYASHSFEVSETITFHR
jgi:hypothetical protein